MDNDTKGHVRVLGLLILLVFLPAGVAAYFGGWLKTQLALGIVALWLGLGFVETVFSGTFWLRVLLRITLGIPVALLVIALCAQTYNEWYWGTSASTSSPASGETLRPATFKERDACCSRLNIHSLERDDLSVELKAKYFLEGWEACMATSLQGCDKVPVD